MFSKSLSERYLQAAQYFTDWTSYGWHSFLSSHSIHCLFVFLNFTLQTCHVTVTAPSALFFLCDPDAEAYHLKTLIEFLLKMTLLKFVLTSSLVGETFSSDIELSKLLKPIYLVQKLSPPHSVETFTDLSHEYEPKLPSLFKSLSLDWLHPLFSPVTTCTNCCLHSQLILAFSHAMQMSVLFIGSGSFNLFL